MGSRLQDQIQTSGPMSIADFMALALYDPQDGYYVHKIPIGRQGDYITAPEMTQVFGETVAAWLVDQWDQAGQPQPFHLVELGPGRGTLMADILRTFQALKVPHSEVHLIDISGPLKELQKKTLQSFPYQMHWHETLSTLPIDKGFCLMIANEFWDAMPIQQFIQIDRSWIERCIDLKDNQFIFTPKDGPIREVCPSMPSLVSQISAHLKHHGGTALFLDYGYIELNALGDTLQALFHHKPQSPLENIGQADLTHHVDFHRLKTLFEAEQLTVDLTSQGDFLKSIGFEDRTEHLCAKATPKQRSALRTAAVRLMHPKQMGELFKVLMVSTR